MPYGDNIVRIIIYKNVFLSILLFEKSQENA
jgi:hypothetical protein